MLPTGGTYIRFSSTGGFSFLSGGAELTSVSWSGNTGSGVKTETFYLARVA